MNAGAGRTQASTKLRRHVTTRAEKPLRSKRYPVRSGPSSDARKERLHQRRQQRGRLASTHLNAAQTGSDARDAEVARARQPRAPTAAVARPHAAAAQGSEQRDSETPTDWRKQAGAALCSPVSPRSTARQASSHNADLRADTRAPRWEMGAAYDNASSR